MYVQKLEIFRRLRHEGKHVFERTLTTSRWKNETCHPPEFPTTALVVTPALPLSSPWSCDVAYLRRRNLPKDGRHSCAGSSGPHHPGSCPAGSMLSPPPNSKTWIWPNPCWSLICHAMVAAMASIRLACVWLLKRSPLLPTIPLSGRVAVQIRSAFSTTLTRK